MFAATATGVEKSACSQPELVSLLKVTLASSVPPLVQRWPECVPVFCGPL